jgi:hypothetical protein
MNYISPTAVNNITVSFPRRRESRQFNKPRLSSGDLAWGSGQSLVVSLCENYFFYWIPACAGMTEREGFNE